MSYRNGITTYLTMSHSNGITAAIRELRNQTGSSSSNIKKTMQENDFADRKWMNAMFLYTLNRMVANGTLIKVKDNYTLIEAETIEHTTEAANETTEAIEQTINASAQTSNRRMKPPKPSNKPSNHQRKP